MSVHRIAVVVAVCALGVAGGLAGGVGAASAASCTGQVRYAASSNTLYLTSGDVTLRELAALCPSAPLAAADSAGTWDLGANLVVQNGATLRVKGPSAGGEVATLRLRSRATGTRVDVVEVTANYGNLVFDSVAVTSWDDVAGSIDINPELAAGAPAGSRGRAFVRALSFIDPATGLARESRMDITDSDFGYLGWYGGESYGVSYKARGCEITRPDLCDKVAVYGSQVNSRFHHLYFGTYTWGAEGMLFDGNEYDHNVMYGLDPHDDSDNLTITDNHFHNNGTHGFICSQRCNNLYIARNVSNNNGNPPHVAAADDNPADNQVHGIMLHRGVTDSIVENNLVYDNINGAGIAVFDSMRNTVRNNEIRGNEYGIRVSVGSRDNQFVGNLVADSSQYAVFTFAGSDQAVYGNLNGRNTDLVFTDNTFSGSGSDLIKLREADRVSFIGNTVAGVVGPMRIDSSTGIDWQGTTLPGRDVMLRNTTGPASGTLRNLGVPVKVSLGSAGTYDIVNDTGRLMAPSRGPATNTVDPANARLSMSTASQGAASLTVRPLAVRVRPTAGTVTITPGAQSATQSTFVVAGGQPGSPLAWTAGGMTAGRRYSVVVDAVTLTTVTADSQGTVRWSLPVTSTASRSLVLTRLA